MSDIYIIAWGSLLWSPRQLAMAGTWTPTGPTLPIEFSRIAADGRLTLIVDHEVGEECATWVCRSPLSLPDAVSNLASRERCDPKLIGWINLETTRFNNPGCADTRDRVAAWCASTGGVAALWTALPATFQECAGRPFSVSAAIGYLGSLRGSKRDRAFEYIRNAPATTQTPVRRAFDQKWPGAPPPHNTQS